MSCPGPALPFVPAEREALLHRVNASRQIFFAIRALQLPPLNPCQPDSPQNHCRIGRAANPQACARSGHKHTSYNTGRGVSSWKIFPRTRVSICRRQKRPITVFGLSLNVSMRVMDRCCSAAICRSTFVPRPSLRQERKRPSLIDR